MSYFKKQVNQAMFFRLIAIFSMLAGMVCVNSAFAQGAEIKMVIGQIETIALPSKVVRVALGNGKIITTNVLETEMVLLGEAPGTTSMRLWMVDGKQLNYNVTVLSSDLDLSVKRMREMLGAYADIKVERVGDLILMTGTASKANMARIEAVAKLFPSTHNAVREEEVTMRRMVYMKVQIVELKKSLGEQIGIQWDKAIAGPAAAVAGTFNSPPLFQLSPSASVGIKWDNEKNVAPIGGAGWRPYIGLTTAITSMINLGVATGDAFVLASPELSARSGGKAEFLAGGQIPILTPASANAPATVTFKDYGIKLTIEPVADDKNNINALLKTEVSNVDNSVAVGGNPGFLSRKTDSEFNVQSGQTIILSGLVNKELQSDVSKLAGLGDLPVLGALFRSNNYRNGRTDLVIFVTPTVIDPVSGINQERLQKAQEIENIFDAQTGAKRINN